MAIGALIILAPALSIARSHRLASYPSGAKLQGVVERVYDGDTVGVKIGSLSERVRILGVDAPETDGPYTKREPFGEKAKQFTQTAVLNKVVTISLEGATQRDKYKRLLARLITPEGESLGAELIKRGLAKYYKRYRYPEKKEFKKLQSAAQKKCRGLWRLELERCGRLITY